MVAAFSPQEIEKKKRCTYLVNIIDAHKGRAGCHHADQGKEEQGGGGSPGSAKDIVLLFLVALCKVKWGDEVDRGRFSCHGIELARPL